MIKVLDIHIPYKFSVISIGVLFDLQNVTCQHDLPGECHSAPPRPTPPLVIQ